ncbi:MAG: helix-turn-helix transcriptional regulator [Rhodoglobus sp.]
MKIGNAEDIGRLARQRRIDLGLSQDDLASRAGVTRQWLSRFEQSKADVTLSKALAIMRELDLTIDVRPAQKPGTINIPSIRLNLPTVSNISINSEAVSQMVANLRRATMPQLSEATRAALRDLSTAAAVSPELRRTRDAYLKLHQSNYVTQTLEADE